MSHLWRQAGEQADPPTDADYEAFENQPVELCEHCGYPEDYCRCHEPPSTEELRAIYAAEWVEVEP